MTDPTPARPVPRWLHAWAVLAVAATFVLLALGQMVTSFRAGMADPVWPTEPWYVVGPAGPEEKERFQRDFGFFIEHTHRIAGWTVGGMTIILAIAVWARGVGAGRWVGLAGILILFAGFLQLHRGLMAQRNVNPADVKIPMDAVGAIGVGFGLAILTGLTGLLTRISGAGLRLIGLVALIAVMVQGLLGGLRVMLNALVGPDLAMIHGIFAQVVFGLLVTIAVLTGRFAGTEDRPRRAVVWWSVGLAALLFVQIVWGAMVRHDPTPLTQRLHFLTAFAATAVAVWVLRAVFLESAARARAGWVAWAFAGVLVAQLYLGVEAWMAKFGAYTLPELVPVTVETATIRTLHALVGSALWAAAVALAVRLGRTAVVGHEQPEARADGWDEVHGRGPVAAGAARFGGDAQ